MMTTGVWHPIALSVSIEPGSSAGTHVGGRELVVWRDNSGVAHVWEDRCPHRGMKLSFGFVRGDHIACLYHGWQYDTAGQCRYIPAHPDLKVPRSITVATYRTAEASGMIWAAIESAESAAPALPEDAGEVVPIRSVYVDVGADALLAAIEATPPRPFGGTERSVAAKLQRVGAKLHSLAAGADTLLLGLQSLSDNRTALHVVVAGPASSYVDKGQAHFLAWTAELRHRLDAQSAGSNHITEAA